jgi:hypothetical protein
MYSAMKGDDITVCRKQVRCGAGVSRDRWSAHLPFRSGIVAGISDGSDDETAFPSARESRYMLFYTDWGLRIRVSDSAMQNYVVQTGEGADRALESGHRQEPRTSQEEEI